MATVFDVADCILQKKGEMTAMKLQKLVYYCQAWSLVWDERPLFNERIEAWANGPVAPDLYQEHKGQFVVHNEQQGDCANLTDDELETVAAVLDHYGDKSAQWLSDLTHSEDPWINARGKLAPGVRGNVEITHGAMADYYGNI